MVTRGGPGSAAPQQIGGVWGEENKIVVGIDIGTTQSGVALSYLAKGEKQEVHRISRWPGQGEQDQRAKIPTAELFGAEALSRKGRNAAAKNSWVLVKHFKLHLQPEDLRKEDSELDPLPLDISLAQVYSDFLGYLLKHTKAYVEKRILLGKQIWEKCESTMEVVLAHPNGWGADEQDFLRQAAIDSGFVHPDKASSQVRFVTEAEASIHYCLHHSNLSKRLQEGTNLAVCDAGGSTVDTTLYSVVSTGPVVQLREAQISDSVQAGGIFVNAEFDKFMRQALKDLGLSQDKINEFATTGADDFENFAKRNFGHSDDSTTDSEPVSIQIASSSFSHRTTPTKVYRGCMEVPISTIQECFDVCARPILSSVSKQLKNQDVQNILFVGGFGDSPYLHTQFESHFGSDGCEVVLANDLTSKAVAEGSVIWNVLCSVVSRTPRYSFGMICARACLPWMPEAEGRVAYIGPQGIPMIPGKWVQIAKKGVPVGTKETFRSVFHRAIMESNPTTLSLTVDLFSYSGDDEPMWAKDREGNLYPKFKKVCTMTAQLWDLEGAVKKETGLLGIGYWDLTVNVCICFGDTELKARLEWEKNGVRLEGPEAMVPGRPIDL
ncbi:hypothetical protein FRC11_011083 [Ceratobasidium sp. 423]|nr:hypothetical protein FRC11_011083 [Ceratobasidium sp. 423]